MLVCMFVLDVHVRLCSEGEVKALHCIGMMIKNRG